MWYLTSKKTGQVFYLLFCKEKYIVSRSVGDLILLNDTSISRTHASINLHLDNTITLVDCNAKYGTYLNENIEKKKKLEPNVPYLLKQNDRVQFGLMGHEWKVSKINICVLPSTLSTEEIELLTKKINLLSGNIINVWSKECTHLVMSTITITVKLLIALVSSTPIVKPDYFSDLIKAIKTEQNSLPDAESYIPDIEEPYLYQEQISFQPNILRKSIFCNKTFIFLNQRQFEKYEMIIKAGSGQCQVAAKTKLTKSLLSKPEVLIVEYEASTESQNSQSVNKISEIICKQGRRLIPDSEIGLAILYCSTDKFCNSEYDFVPKFDPLTNNEKESIDYTNVISVDTPVDDEPKKSINLPHVEIPATEDSPKTDMLSPFIDLTDNNQEELEVVELPVGKRVTRSSGSSFVLKVPVATKTNKRKSTSKSVPEVTSDENVNKKRKISLDKIEEGPSSNDNDKVPIEETKIIPNKVNIINKNDSGNKRKKSVERQTSNKKSRKTLENEEILKTIEIPPEIPAVEVRAPVFTKPNNPVKPFTSIFAKSKRPQKSQDDDDDDLFQFEESQAKRVATEPINRIDKTMENTQNMTQDLYSGQSLLSLPLTAVQNKSKNKNSYAEDSTYKIKPVDITLLGGWLSKFNQMNIEDDKKLIQPKDEETIEWIKSIRNAFEVKSVAVLSKSVSIEKQNSTKTKESINSSKNFKAFVKKNNFIPQTRIIKTFPVPELNQTIV